MADLPLPRRGSAAEPPPFEHLRGLPLTEAKTMLVEQFERSAIEAALADNKGNISAAARQLGLHRQSLQQKMGALGLIRPSPPTTRPIEERGQR
jgi:DNA-binding NtrC family response regulator